MAEPSAEDPQYPGDPRHPDHEQWLLALGRATYASQSLAGVAVDVLRIHCGVDFWTLLPDTLGALIRRLKHHEGTGAPRIPGLLDWLSELDRALIIRNDLIHALPVLHGLHRRTASDHRRVVDFCTTQAMEDAAAVLSGAAVSGNRVLYHDGGAAVRVWAQAS